MIANFFNKTKPINTLFIIGLLLFIYLFSIILHLDEEITLYFMAKKAGNFSLLLVIIFTVNFIVRKNNLTKDNSYIILVFVILFGMFPFSVLEFELLVVNLILLFAYRRIYSLRTSKETQKKIFDSAFWIGIATIIAPWSLLAILLIYVAIYLFDKVTWRNAIVPLVGFCSPIVIYIAYLYLINGIDTFSEDFKFMYSFSFGVFNSSKLLIPLALVSSLIIWSIFPTTFKITTVNNEFKNSWYLVIFHFFIVLFVVLPWPVKNGSELLLLFFPIAVIFTNYLQIIEEKWFKEVFLYVLLGVVLTVFIL